MKVMMMMTTRTKMDPCAEREVSEYLQEPHADAPGIVISYSFLTLFMACLQFIACLLGWGYSIKYCIGRQTMSSPSFAQSVTCDMTENQEEKWPHKLLGRRRTRKEELCLSQNLFSVNLNFTLHASNSIPYLDILPLLPVVKRSQDRRFQMS